MYKGLSLVYLISVQDDIWSGQNRTIPEEPTGRKERASANDPEVTVVSVGFLTNT